ncbi:MAG: molybdenum cofactor biosynthesis protein MoaE [Promethearchaeota archaeon]
MVAGREPRPVVPGVYKKGDVRLEDVVAAVKADPCFSEVGALTSFVGVVRSTSQDPASGKGVTGMLVEANEPLANQALRDICRTLEREEDDVKRVVICHLVGQFGVSEDLVYVVVAAGHRKAAFTALERAVEMYKRAAAIWKKEIFGDGTGRWVS